jgi:hypothetical protein
MLPKNHAFGGGATETMLDPMVAVWMLIAILLILTLPRKKAIVPFLLACFTIPLAQVVLVGPLHFPVLRILILAGLARTAAQGGPTSKRRFPGGFNRLDKVVVLWTVVSLVANFLQWMDPQSLIKLIGDFLDTLGSYLVVRFLIPDRETVRRTIEVLALICVIQGVCMMSEQSTHRNVFASWGAYQPTMRNGHLRSEGVMGTLYAGTFAGVVIPLFLWLRTEKKFEKTAVAGLVGATAMVMASHASTAWLAYGSGLVGLCFWPLRKRMQFVRYGIVATLVVLHLSMNGPVWSLIEKIDLTGGSSSFHRYMLVDNCIRHFDQWWLLGFRYPGTWGFDMWDLCNQFVAVALGGGLVGLSIYIAIYSRGFAAIGNARKQVNGDHRYEWFLWAFGSTLFANVVASFGINYLLPLLLLFFPLLACISVASSEAKQKVARDANPSVDLLLPSALPSVGKYLPLGETS